MADLNLTYAPAGLDVLETNGLVPISGPNDWLVGGGSNGVLGASTTGGGASQAPSYNQDDLNYLNDQENSLRAQLARADTTLNQGLTQLGDSYNKEVSGANTQRGRALENFNTQIDDTTRDKVNAINQVDTNARTLNDSLRRILGMASGRGSSAYKFAAPNAVARDASQRRSGVNETFGTNFRNIDTAKNRASEDFATLLDDLAAQKQQRESSLREGVLTSKNSINSNLANLAGERAKLLGGGYGAVRIAQQPFQDQITGNNAAIDNLFNQYRSPYSVKAIDIQKPDLGAYTVDKAALASNTQGAGAYSPYSAFLKKKQEGGI